MLGLQWQKKSAAARQAQQAKAKTEAPEILRPNRYRYLRWTLITAAVLAGVSIWYFYPKLMEEKQVVETAIAEIADIVGCRDSTATNYNPRATVDCDNCCDYTPAAPEPPEAREDLSDLAQRDSVSVPPSFATISDKPLPLLDPIPDNALQWLSDYKWPVSFLLWGLLLVLSLGYYLWRRANRQYLARQNRADEPPYRLPIKIRRAQPITLSDDFFLAINRLRGRELGERRKMDVRKTVAATIRRGGFANFQYRTLTRPVEYLILIDKQADQHHQAQLFEYIYREIVRQEVYAERYFFDGDPRYCWNDQHPGGVPLERLLQRHSTARLLVLADGYSFINPASGQLEGWTKALGGWQQRALLSPAPVAGWNFREAILASFFLLLPGNVQGLSQVVRHFEGLPTPGLRDWKYDFGQEDRPLEPDEERVVESLSGKLSPAMMRWLTACAVYPELHWDLTLELGATLSEPGEELVTFGNVAQLARLPWFRQGYMTGEVREQLLHSAYLSDKDRLAVRAAIVSVLKANTPENTHSYAYEEHQLHLAINQTLLSRLPAERQEWIQRYRELHAKGVREDQVSMVELDRHFNTLLDFQLPQAFFPKGRQLLGVRSMVPALLAALLALVVYVLGLFVPDPCGGTVAQLTADVEARYCLQTPEDSLAFFAYEAVLLTDSFQLDSLLKRSTVVAALQPDTPAITRKDSLYYTPVQAHLWNRALAAYDTADYENAATLAQKLKELLEAEANDRINQRPGTSSMLDDPTQEKWGYYWRCLELLGRAAFFANDRELAQQFAGQVEGAGAYSGLLPPPNLQILLTYDFVDTLHLTRIRVRQGGRYGFLDEGGQPIWKGVQPSFDYAWNYRVEQDTIKALTLSGTSQCYIDLAGERIPGSCFTDLTPFQNTAGLFGYENENGFAVIPAQYSEAGEFTADRLAWVKKNGESGYGYIRFDGSDLLRTNDLETAGDFRQGLAAVQRNGRYGYLNTQGEMTIAPQFDQAGDFDARGRAQVQRGDRTYAINRSGDCVSGDCPSRIFQGQINGQLTSFGDLGPIDGVQISVLVDKVVTERVTTNLQGEYRFTLREDIDPGQIELRLEKAAYQTVTYSPQIADERPGNVRLEPFNLFMINEYDGERIYKINCVACHGLNGDVSGIFNLKTSQLSWEEVISVITNGRNAMVAYGTLLSEEEIKAVAVYTMTLRTEKPAAMILPEMITIPGGTFTMGCLEGRDSDCYNDESPAHEVTVASFGMGKYEVTNEEFAAFLNLNGEGNKEEGGVEWIDLSGGSSEIKAQKGIFVVDQGYEKHPVVYVSWYGARAYAAWLSQQTGEQYRLPTEAEWEFAARGGAKSQGYLYAGSNDPDAVAWYYSNSNSSTHPIGQKRPNELGLYDMSGNVYEWCRDWYDAYPSEPQTNPTGPENSDARVIRGGSWYDVPAVVRCAFRNGDTPAGRRIDIGFRLSRPVK